MDHEYAVRRINKAYLQLAKARGTLFSLAIDAGVKPADSPAAVAVCQTMKLLAPHCGRETNLQRRAREAAEALDAA